MRALEPELLIPGHGLPIFGAARIRQVLDDTAEWLRDTGARDARADERRRHARCDRGTRCGRPAHLADAVLRPVYDEPEYVVRNIWRLYGGWWDGVASHLKPAADAALAGAGRWPAASSLLAGRASWPSAATSRWPATGRLAVQAAPDDRAAHALRAEIYTARAASSAALMTRGISPPPAGVGRARRPAAGLGFRLRPRS